MNGSVRIVEKKMERIRKKVEVMIVCCGIYATMKRQQQQQQNPRKYSIISWIDAYNWFSRRFGGFQDGEFRMSINILLFQGK